MHALVLITVGHAEEAREIARLLVEERLAAGVQMIPIQSVYEWLGEVVEDHEWLLIAKTRAERFAEVEDAVLEEHSYDVAPIYMLDIEAGSVPYLDWIDSVLGAEGSGA